MWMRTQTISTLGGGSGGWWAIPHAKGARRRLTQYLHFGFVCETLATIEHVERIPKSIGAAQFLVGSICFRLFATAGRFSPIKYHLKLAAVRMCVSNRKIVFGHSRR